MTAADYVPDPTGLEQARSAARRRGGPPREFPPAPEPSEPGMLPARWRLALAGWAAGVLGWCARPARLLPGLGAVGCATAGTWLLWGLGWALLVAAGFCLLLDARTPRA